MQTEHRGLAIALAVLVLLVLLVPLVGGGMMGSGMMGWYGPPGAAGGGPGGWSWGLAVGLGWLSMLAFWGAVIVGIALLVRWVSGLSGPRGAGPETVLDILKRRYAAGELTREQYEQMRQVLEQ